MPDPYPMYTFISIDTVRWKHFRSLSSCKTFPYIEPLTVHILPQPHQLASDLVSGKDRFQAAHELLTKHKIPVKSPSETPAEVENPPVWQASAALWAVDLA